MTVATALDPLHLRRSFSAFPSGVTVIAGLAPDGTPLGLVASSFTSVSLQPALVSMCIAHTSGTWPLLTGLPVLGVSVLAADQGWIARQVSARRPDRFAGVEWRATADGAVVLDGASGWMEVSVQQQIRAGDHDIVVLAVHELNADPEMQPLVFHGSRFRQLA